MKKKQEDYLIEDEASDYNRRHGVEWPYGYPEDGDARQRQLAHWNGTSWRALMCRSSAPKSAYSPCV